MRLADPVYADANEADRIASGLGKMVKGINLTFRRMSQVLQGEIDVLNLRVEDRIFTGVLHGAAFRFALRRLKGRPTRITVSRVLTSIDAGSIGWGFVAGETGALIEAKVFFASATSVPQDVAIRIE